MVVASGVTGLGMVRSLGRAGVPTLVLAPGADLVHRSRWGRPLPGRAAAAAEGADDPRPLAERLAEAEPESGVLIPGSDSAVREIVALPPALRERFATSVPPADTLDVLTDKQAFARFTREHGLPHPLTIEPHGPDGGLEDLDADFFTRAFLKPRDSQRFFARFGVKGIHVRSREEALRRIARLEAEGFPVVVQEYIPGPPTAHVFLDGFVDRRGRLALLLTRRRTRMYPEDFGNSTLCETVPPSEVAPAVDALRRLLDSLSYRGIFSTEVKRDDRTGEYRFLEVNARAWWYVEFAARCGVNVCEAAYRDALGLPLPRCPEVPGGVRLLYPEYDLTAFRARRREDGSRRDRPSAWAWFRPWLGARQALLVGDDPWPALWQTGARLRRRLAHDSRRRA